MNGVGDDKFAPEGTVTRAQLVTILYRMAEQPEAAGASVFSDVPDGQWYSKAIQWAAAAGIVNGIPSDDLVRLAPNKSATRAQIAAIIMRYLEG